MISMIEIEPMVTSDVQSDHITIDKSLLGI